jgi:proliferating cell nuclear antigen PCNA
MGISNGPEYGESNIVEFRTVQIKPFKQMFESIKNNLPDTSIFFSVDGMKILQMEAFNTFMVNVNLNGDEFEHYYCNPTDGNSVVELNLSTTHLTQAFKSVTNDDNTMCFFYEENSDNINLIFSSEKKGESRSYEIKIQHADNADRLGEIEGISAFPYSLTMPCADLKQIFTNFKTLNSEQIIISHDGTTLGFKCEGQINSVVRRKGSKGAPSATGVSFTKMPSDFMDTPSDYTYTDIFKFALLYEFSKCQSGGDSKIVRIFLEKGSPIVLQFEIGTLGNMTVAIAPYKSSEDPSDNGIMIAGASTVN